LARQTRLDGDIRSGVGIATPVAGVSSECGRGDQARLREVRRAQRTADHYPTGAGVEGAAPLPVA